MVRFERMARGVARGLVLVLGTLAVGCGPSLRLVQQSHVYFERCYSADFDARIAPGEKHACWSAWLQHYTIGQPPERRDYARQRLYAIEQGESVPRLPGLPETAVAQQVTTFTVPTAQSDTDAQSPDAQSPDAQSGAQPDAQPEPPEAAVPAAVEAEAAQAGARVARPERRPREHRMPPLPRTVNQPCAIAACQPSWQECIEACPIEGRECAQACRVELNNCARGCF